MRVGGTKTIPLDIRIVAATNKNLQKATKEGTFREDLYYRLNVVSITMPALRDHKDDVPLLASYFAAKYAEKCNRRVLGISPDARAILSQYDWPGNIRELENAIERAVVLATHARDGFRALNDDASLDDVYRLFPELRAAPPAPHARLVFRNKTSLEQTHLYMGVPGYAFPHKLRFACYALNTVLGGGMSSRLFQSIREERGLAYSIYSELSPFRDTGSLAVYAGCAVERTREVLDLTLAELGRMRSEPVSEDDLRRAKDQIKGNMVLGLESSSSRMSSLARVCGGSAIPARCTQG